MRRTNHGSHYYKATVIFRQQQSQRQIFFRVHRSPPHGKSSKRSCCCCCKSSAGIDSRLPAVVAVLFSFFSIFQGVCCCGPLFCDGVCFSQDPSGDSQDVHNLSFPCVLFSFLLPSDSRRSRRKQNGKKDSQRSLARPVRAYTQTVGRCASRSQPRGRRGGGRKVRRWRRHRIRKWKIAAAAVGQTKRVVNFQGEIKLKAS